MSEWEQTDGGLLMPKKREEPKPGERDGDTVPLGQIGKVVPDDGLSWNVRHHYSAPPVGYIRIDWDDVSPDGQCRVLVDEVNHDGLAGRGPGHLVIEDYNFDADDIAFVMFEYADWFGMSDEDQRERYPDYHHDPARANREIKSIREVFEIMQKAEAAIDLTGSDWVEPLHHSGFTPFPDDHIWSSGTIDCSECGEMLHCGGMDGGENMQPWLEYEEYAVCLKCAAEDKIGIWGEVPGPRKGKWRPKNPHKIGRDENEERYG